MKEHCFTSTSGSREWIPEAGDKQEDFYNTPTLQIVSNAYMEGVLRQRQTVSPRREIYDSIQLEFTGESYIERTVGGTGDALPVFCRELIVLV